MWLFPGLWNKGWIQILQFIFGILLNFKSITLTSCSRRHKWQSTTSYAEDYFSGTTSNLTFKVPALQILQLLQFQPLLCCSLTQGQSNSGAEQGCQVPQKLCNPALLLQMSTKHTEKSQREGPAWLHVIPINALQTDWPNTLKHKWMHILELLLLMLFASEIYKAQDLSQQLYNKKVFCLVCHIQHRTSASLQLWIPR